MSEVNGSIATGGTAETAVSLNRRLVGWFFRNESDTDMRVSDAQTPTASLGLLLGPDEAYECVAPMGTSVQVFCASSGKAYYCRAW